MPDPLDLEAIKVRPFNVWATGMVLTRSERDALVAEIERLRAGLHRLTHVVDERGCTTCEWEEMHDD